MADDPDTSSLATVAVSVAMSEVAVASAERLTELDPNPVLVHRAGQGVTVVDVLARCSAEVKESGTDVADR